MKDIRFRWVLVAVCRIGIIITEANCWDGIVVLWSSSVLLLCCCAQRGIFSDTSVSDFVRSHYHLLVASVCQPTSDRLFSWYQFGHCSAWYKFEYHLIDSGSSSNNRSRTWTTTMTEQSLGTDRDRPLFFGEHKTRGEAVVVLKWFVLSFNGRPL